VLLEREHFSPHHARDGRPAEHHEDEGDLVEAGLLEDGDQPDGQDERRERHHHVGHAHQERVAPAAVVAGQEADRDPERRGHDLDAQAQRERDAASIEHAREEIAAEREDGTGFTVDDVADGIVAKLIRRHPHVFADGSAKTSDDVKRRWDEIKADEKKSKGEPVRGLLESVPRNLPALVEAQQISSKAAGVGFDWENADQVLDKLDEELDELAGAREGGSREELEGEIGDLLFVLVNLARFMKVDPEQALRKTNAKFRKRFAHVEAGAKLPGATIEEMEALWQEAKRADD